MLEKILTVLGVISIIITIGNLSIKDAFWGITVFIFISILLVFFLGAISTPMIKLMEWWYRPTEPLRMKPMPVVRSAHIVKEKKHPLASKIFWNAMLTFLFYLVNCFIVMGIAAIGNWKTYRMEPWVLAILPALPIIAFYIVGAIRALINKKHARRGKHA